MEDVREQGTDQESVLSPLTNPYRAPARRLTRLGQFFEGMIPDEKIDGDGLTLKDIDAIARAKHHEGYDAGKLATELKFLNGEPGRADERAKAFADGALAQCRRIGQPLDEFAKRLRTEIDATVAGHEGFGALLAEINAIVGTLQSESLSSGRGSGA